MDSTRNLAQLTAAQAGKETTVNDLVDALSPSSYWGRKPASSGLTWHYYGGKLAIDGVITAIADGSLTLTASATNYVEQNLRTGAVSSNTTAHTAGRRRLYTVVTGASSVTSYTDHRNADQPPTGRLSLALSDANTTLNAAQASNQILRFSGSLTAQRDIVLPDPPHVWQIDNDTGQPLRCKTSAQTGGVIIAAGRRGAVRSDGTNILSAAPNTPESQSIAYAAAITPDANLGRVIIVGALTGALTVNAPNNTRAGDVLIFHFTQDATGSRVVTWNGAYRKAADAAGGAGQKGSTAFFHDGTDLVQIGGALTWY